MSLFEELIEDKELDKKILKSFKGKSDLCHDIFQRNDGEYVMRDNIRKKLIQIVDEYIDFIGVEFFIHDIVLTGSLSNYNWSEFSDIDIHIILDIDEFDDKKESDSTVYHAIIKDFFLIIPFLCDNKDKIYDFIVVIIVRHNNLDKKFNDIIFSFLNLILFYEI